MLAAKNLSIDLLQALSTIMLHNCYSSRARHPLSFLTDSVSTCANPCTNVNHKGQELPPEVLSHVCTTWISMTKSQQSIVWFATDGHCRNFAHPLTFAPTMKSKFSTMHGSQTQQVSAGCQMRSGRNGIRHGSKRHWVLWPMVKRMMAVKVWAATPPCLQPLAHPRPQSQLTWMHLNSSRLCPTLWAWARGRQRRWGILWWPIHWHLSVVIPLWLPRSCANSVLMQARREAHERSPMAPHYLAGCLM